MFLGSRLCLLVPIATLVLSRAGFDDRRALITAPALARRQEDQNPLITSRSDFIGYELGNDNTWTPSFCYGSRTTYSGLLDCCTDGGSCDFIIGCQSGSLLETIFGSSETRSSRTLTISCGGGINPLPGTCNSAFIYEDTADQNPLTSFYCAFGLGFHTAPSYYKHLTAAAPVWFTTPSDIFAATTAPSSTQSQRTSSLTTPSSTSSPSSTPSGESTSQDPSTSDTASPSDGSSPTSKTVQTTSSHIPSSTIIPASQSTPPSSTSSSNTKSLAVGIGVGLGVPLILIALLAWYFPRERLKAFFAKGRGLNRPELPGTSAHVPNTGQWVPEMEAPKHWVPPANIAVSPPVVHEIYSSERRELPGS